MTLFDVSACQSLQCLGRTVRFKILIMFHCKVGSAIEAELSRSETISHQFK